MKLITSMLTASLMLAAPIVGAATWEERREAQIKLKAAGHDPGAIDGALGQETRAALRAFQEENDLSVTGRLDANTMEKLGVGSGEAADDDAEDSEDAAAEEEANDEEVEVEESEEETAEEEVEESEEEPAEEEAEESEEEPAEEEAEESEEEPAEEEAEEVSPAEEEEEAEEEPAEEEAEETEEAVEEEESEEEAESDEEELDEDADEEPVAKPKARKKRQAYSMTFAEVYARVGTADTNDDTGEVDFDDVTVSGRFSQQILDNFVIQVGTESLRAEADASQNRVSYHNKYAEVLYRHNYSPRTDFYVGGGYFGTSFREQGANTLDESGFRGRLGLSYKFSKRAHVNAELSYRDLDLEALDGPAADLSLSYKVYGNWAVVLHGQYLVLDEDANEDVIASGGAGVRYYLD